MNRFLLVIAYPLSMALILYVLLMPAPYVLRGALGRDAGQWETADPGLKAWFRDLKQPDDPAKSCCGEADAYFTDDFAVEGESYVAIITDGRADGPLGRPHREIGERHRIPANKIKFDNGNPTGHGILFISVTGTVYCYLPPSGT